MTITQTLTAFATGAALLLTQPAFAGGPVLVEDAYEAEPQAKNKAGWIVPVVVGLAIIAAIAASNDSCNGPDDTPAPSPGPCP